MPGTPPRGPLVRFKLMVGEPTGSWPSYHFSEDFKLDYPGNVTWTFEGLPPDKVDGVSLTVRPEGLEEAEPVPARGRQERVTDAPRGGRVAAACLTCRGKVVRVQLVW